MTSFTSPGHNSYLGFLFWHLWIIHPTHARINTSAHVCTKLTHALSRKVLSLTKPKGKIYKTKSLGHYITAAPWGQMYIQWRDTPDLNRPSHHGRPNVSHHLDMSLLERLRRWLVCGQFQWQLRLEKDSVLKIITEELYMRKNWEMMIRRPPPPIQVS